MSRLWIFPLLVVLAYGGSRALADDFVERDQTCPLCQTGFKADVTLSGFQAGQRLDLRPVGAIASPPRIPVCPKCGFALFRKTNKDYPADELKALKAIVASDAYKNLGPKAPSHLRLAKLYEGLKRPPDQIAFAYLRSSWQTENDAEANRALLEQSLGWWEKALATPDKKVEGWETTEFLRGEILRRLGRFDQAKGQFERLKSMKEFGRGPFPKMLAQELDLIRAKDTNPHCIKE